MRTEEQLSWREIAVHLGVDPYWLLRHKRKLEDVQEGRILAIPKEDLDQTLAKIKALRDQKATWKTIAQTLGGDWLKLYRSYRHYTEGPVRK